MPPPAKPGGLFNLSKDAVEAKTQGKQRHSGGRDARKAKDAEKYRKQKTLRLREGGIYYLFTG
jgi:hypothetical protein